MKYFEALGIAPTNDRDIVKQAYRKLILQYHPDKNFGDAAGTAAERARQVIEAWDYLQDQERLNLYYDRCNNSGPEIEVTTSTTTTMASDVDNISADAIFDPSIKIAIYVPVYFNREGLGLSRLRDTHAIIDRPDLTAILQGDYRCLAEEVTRFLASQMSPVFAPFCQVGVDAKEVCDIAHQHSYYKYTGGYIIAKIAVSLADITPKISEAQYFGFGGGRGREFLTLKPKTVIPVSGIQAVYVGEIIRAEIKAALSAEFGAPLPLISPQQITANSNKIDQLLAKIAKFIDARSHVLREKTFAESDEKQAYHLLREMITTINPVTANLLANYQLVFTQWELKKIIKTGNNIETSIKLLIATNAHRTEQLGQGFLNRVVGSRATPCMQNELKELEAIVTGNVQQQLKFEMPANHIRELQN